MKFPKQVPRIQLITVTLISKSQNCFIIQIDKKSPSEQKHIKTYFHIPAYSKHLNILFTCPFINNMSSEQLLEDENFKAFL